MTGEFSRGEESRQREQHLQKPRSGKWAEDRVRSTTWLEWGKEEGRAGPGWGGRSWVCRTGPGTGGHSSRELWEGPSPEDIARSVRAQEEPCQDHLFSVLLGARPTAPLPASSPCPPHALPCPSQLTDQSQGQSLAGSRGGPATPSRRARRHPLSSVEPRGWVGTHRHRQQPAWKRGQGQGRERMAPWPACSPPPATSPWQGENRPHPQNEEQRLGQFWSGSHRSAVDTSPAKFFPEQIVQPVPAALLPCFPLLI